MKKKSITALLIVIIFVIVILLLVWFLWKKTSPSSLILNNDNTIKADSLEYVGRQACVECHKKEHDLWKGSPHDLAMQVADQQTVLGNFDNFSITIQGITSRFYKKESEFFVHTEGEQGKLKDYKISYTFGIYPLQQYLVEFPDGRIQVLPLCWDTRPQEKGGQRWFHIYKDEPISPKDILFWTRLNQNWNFMCAECHSTNVKKNYNHLSGKYQTTFSEIDVSCEMCHGPGSGHVQWAKIYEKEKRLSLQGNMGLQVRLKDLNNGTWVFTDMVSGTAERTVPLSSGIQIETCALCHSRRSALTDAYIHDRPLLNTHSIPVLDEPLYYVDGQIREEVYVYHSFLQSKMYHKGVICSNCHEPHSTKIYNSDNSLCFRCHLPQKYDTKAHHFHKPDSTGGLCMDCHMPERTYMVIDPRRDHSIRIPRPDLSEKLGTPNACNQCHKDKTRQWATDYIIQWYGKAYTARQHYGEVFHAARNGHPQAGNLLHQLVQDANQSNMVKATAVSLLPAYPGPETTEILRSMLHHLDPLLRMSAVNALERFENSSRFAMAKHLLEDPVKAVRLRAAYILSDISREALTGFDQGAFDAALSEYIETQFFNGDRPSSYVNLGVVYLRQGDAGEAEAAYKKAISIEPGYVYGYINLVDLYREQGRETEGEAILQIAISYNPGSAELYYAYGLLLTRLKKRSQALAAFETAVKFQPENTQLQYYLALAYLQNGQTNKSLKLLEKANKINPYNPDVLFALTTINRDRGEIESALKNAQKLYEIGPENNVYQQLLEQIKAMENNNR